MLYDALKFLAEYLNQMFLAGGTPGGEDILEWGNIAQLELLTPGNDTLENRIVLTLVNLDEEKTLRNGKHILDNGAVKIAHQPAVHLNLFLLFSMRFTDYDNAIRNLSNVITFFQQHPVLTPANAPGMPAGLEKLLFELVSLGLEQQNNLWSVLGGKHYPSVLYKTRLVRVLELPVEEAPLIKEIISNEENVIR